MKEDQELLEKAIDTLRNGGEIYWYDAGIKHVSSMKNPHNYLPFQCHGQCCKESEESP